MQNGQNSLFKKMVIKKFKRPVLSSPMNFSISLFDIIPTGCMALTVCMLYLIDYNANDFAAVTLVF